MKKRRRKNVWMDRVNVFFDIFIFKATVSIIVDWTGTDSGTKISKNSVYSVREAAKIRVKKILVNKVILEIIIINYRSLRHYHTKLHYNRVK